MHKKPWLKFNYFPLPTEFIYSAEINTYSLRIKTNRKGTIKGMKRKKVNLIDDS